MSRKCHGSIDRKGPLCCLGMWCIIFVFRLSNKTALSTLSSYIPTHLSTKKKKVIPIRVILLIRETVILFYLAVCTPSVCSWLDRLQTCSFWIPLFSARMLFQWVPITPQHELLTEWIRKRSSELLRFFQEFSKNYNVIHLIIFEPIHSNGVVFFQWFLIEVWTLTSRLGNCS